MVVAGGATVQLLVVGQDKAHAQWLKKALRAQYYTVDIAAEGEAANLAPEDFLYDLIILDVVRPHNGALELLRHIRSNNPAVPIFLLAPGSYVTTEDRIRALDSGADDCLSKPFSFGEFSARVRALLRRHEISKEPLLRVGDLELDWTYMTVSRSGRRIQLSRKEFSLLAYFMKNAGRPLTRQMILDRVWGLASDPFTNVVDVYVSYLRRKVDNGFERKLIHTLRGVGYFLSSED